MQQTITLPKNIQKCDEEFFLPHLTWSFDKPVLKKRRIRILLFNGLVITPRFLHDTSIAPWTTFFQNHKTSYFIGQILKNILGIRVLMASDIHIVCNTYSNNFFHWITEVLPKINFILQIQPKARFFIPYKTLAPYQIYTLQKFQVNYILAESDCTVLLNPTVIGHVCDYPGYYHPDLLKSVRLKLAPFKKRNPDKRIYISRKNADRRKLINEDSISDILKIYNFDFYDFDETSFKEQLKIAQEAHVIVSIHGAALTNMAFMQQGSNVIEFLPAKRLIDKCYFTLAETLGLNYHYLFCETDKESHIIANYKANPESFKALLAKIL